MPNPLYDYADPNHPLLTPPTDPNAYDALMGYVRRVMATDPAAVQQALRDQAAAERQRSVDMGYADPNTGLPTAKGAADIAGQWGRGVMLGTTAPGEAPMANPAFREWFGASKVTDANGAPLVVFHGTNRDIPVFSGATAGEKTGNVTTPLGHFFTDAPAEASRYATQWGEQGGNVIPAHLSLQNPYEMSPKEFDDIAMSVFRGEKTQSEAMADSAKLRERLRDQGHDGIIIRGRGMRPTEYVAFDPMQIKSSVSNVGSYDPRDPRITYGIAMTTGGAAAANALNENSDYTMPWVDPRMERRPGASVFTPIVPLPNLNQSPGQYPTGALGT